MKRALVAWLRSYRAHGDHARAVVAAAEATAGAPWEVVRDAGLLARCEVAIAEEDLGLGLRLEARAPGAHGVIDVIPKGSPYPVPRHAARRAKGAYDTPVELARRVVAATRVAVTGTLQRGLDPACGTGAFLVAMAEAGIPEIHGSDVDPLAVAVARVAVPKAKIEVRDLLLAGPHADLVVGNPPFVPPERQDPDLRARLRLRFPWLRGRFDLVIPFAEQAIERVRPGGAAGLVLPSPAMVQPYGAALRRRWVERHEIVDLSGPWPFPGATVDVTLAVIRPGRGPAPIPMFGLDPTELLALENVPLNPDLMPGDIGMVRRVRERSFVLGDFCLVDTGVVAHGAKGGKEKLLHERPGRGRVPYADAKDFFEGEHLWLQYDKKSMHRAKSAEMFEKPKVVIQRLRGRAPVRAAIDWDGIYVGHTCTVICPRERRIPLDRILDLVKSPLVDAITRIERGDRLDLYPKDVAAIPVPNAWLERPHLSLKEAWELEDFEEERLLTLASR